MHDAKEQHLQVLGATTHLVEYDWEHHARCRTEDPALFFGPTGFESKQDRQVRERAAKAVCLTCPAIAACRSHALATGEAYGVWGGLGETDRRSVLAQRSRQVSAHAV